MEQWADIWEFITICVGAALTGFMALHFACVPWGLMKHFAEFIAGDTRGDAD